MKTLTTLAAVGGMLLGASANAATFDFVAMADNPGDANYQGEKGFTSFSATVDGITVTATGTDTGDFLTYLADPGSYAGGLNNEFAYLDKNTAGLGVCTVLTTNDQCNPSSDDNATADEVLILDFGTEVTISDLFFRDANHNAINFGSGEDFSLFIDGVFAGIYQYGSPLVASFTGTQFAFSADDFNDGRFVADGDEFYISNVSAVPVPAAVWLLGSALGGLGFMRRRKSL